MLASGCPDKDLSVDIELTNPYRQQQQAKPKMQEVTLRGYYKNGNNWNYTPIRVGIIGDEVRLLSIKTRHGWSNCGNKAGQVGAWDSEEIRDNYTYKAYSSLYGTIYFLRELVRDYRLILLYRPA